MGHVNKLDTGQAQVSMHLLGNFISNLYYKEINNFRRKSLNSLTFFFINKISNKFVKN